MLTPGHLLKFGSYITHHTFNPDAISLNVVQNGSVINDSTFNSENIQAVENYFYLEDEIRFNSRLKANAGLHFSTFHVRGRHYHSLQPRVSVSQMVAPNSSIKASFATMTQYIHLLSNTGVGMPTDIWVPATDKILPQQSWIASAGYFQNLYDGKFEFSTEVYYKEMNNVIEFTEGTDFLKNGPETKFIDEVNNNWEDRVASGFGWTYGAEFFLRKKTGKATGWVGYTLAWANRQFDLINDGKPFPYIYDRRHDVSIVLNHQLSPKIKLGAVWVYNSGYRVTLPEGSYLPYYFDYGKTDSYINQQVVDYISNRNNYQLPDYHRLDLSISFLKQKKISEREWNLALYNAYNRRNPFTVFVTGSNTNTNPSQSGSTQIRELHQLTLFSIIPSISYRYKF
ncbi:MAG: TonB-dependent receptor [Bacteroidota bacterium]|nr:TonB-dependent receptor [Bacteroidota bacterium]